MAKATALAGFLLLVIGSMAACAGEGGSKAITPRGTSQVQVTASAAATGVKHSATVTLTIQ